MMLVQWLSSNSPRIGAKMLGCDKLRRLRVTCENGIPFYFSA
jgi:hypothetical protein